jgi:hypothetical protein
VAGQRVFTWQEGVLVRALRRGAWVLLDEVNLAPPEVLAAIAPLLDRWGNAGSAGGYMSAGVCGLLGIVHLW